MAFKSLRNIRYFFLWLREIFRTWFLPYHYDDDSEEGSSAGAAEKARAKPDAGNVSAETEQAASTQSAVDAVPAESSPYGDSPDLSEAMAFRGAVTSTALGSIVGRSLDEVDQELIRLVDAGTVEELDDGRFLLSEGERRHALRADYRVSEWLSGLQDTNFENEVLDVIEQICRQLPVKIKPGKSLVFHLRQQKWMVWQSRQQTCRVRLFGTLDREQWEHLREIDRRARRFRRKEPHRWDSRDWSSFRWRQGADTLAIESIFIETGREFQKRARRGRRGGGRHRRKNISVKTPQS